MRKLGYAAIDQIVDHFEGIRTKKVLNIKRHEELDALFEKDVPEAGTDPEEMMTFLKDHVFSNILHTDHPRFYSFIPAPSNFITVLADILASGHNVFTGHFMSSSSAAEMEMTTIGWLRKLCGFPQTGGGIFVSGGSIANVMAIITARNIKLNEGKESGVVYFSNQTHSSMVKGLRMINIQPSHYRSIKTDDNFKMDLSDLKSQISSDLKNGLKPFCLIGNAGTTNTGTVDPLVDLSAIAKENDMWFHIDGAYGAAAIVTDEGRDSLKGMESADSLTLDPHKWWFQTFEIGCLLVRDEQHLKHTFHTSAEYLWDTQFTFENEKNYYDYGMQLTRSFRALKLFLSLKVYGLNAFRLAISKGVEMARFVEETLSSSGKWEIVSSAKLGIVNFRYRTNLGLDKSNELSKKISNRVLEDGYSMILTTSLNGITVLRMCPIHPELTKEEVKKTIIQLEKFASEEVSLYA